jgi:nucleoside-diphosphate-sugar epimerase
MSGADWVIHAAAVVSLGKPPAEMRSVNVAGSENVASLACKLGVGRLLSISSIASFGGSPPDGSLATEEAPLQTPFPTLYSATKNAGQKAILEWMKRGLQVNTVYPSLVYGPPGKREGANSVLRSLLLGRIPFLIGARKKASWIYLEDLVEGILRVLEKAPPGRGYLMTGEAATLEGLVTKVCRLGRVKAPRLRLPLPLARGALAALLPLARLTGRRPALSPDQLRSLTRHWAFDDTRARQELDWSPRGLDQGLPPTVEHILQT